ncbi:MAG: YggT family protein [Candidatus Muiribacteriota bacterium]
MNDLIYGIEVFFISLNVMIFLRIVMSWLFVDRHSNDFVDFIYSFTEPLLKPFRVVIPLGMMGLDLSPVIAIIVLNLIKEIIIKLLIS